LDVKIPLVRQGLEKKGAGKARRRWCAWVFISGQVCFLRA
jgi:hypothetical protein